MPFKDGCGGTLEPDLGAIAWPCDVESAAGQVDLHGGRESPQPAADGDRSASAGATGKRLADAALGHPQKDVAGRDDFHEADVSAPWKARMILNRLTEAVHRRARDVRHEKYRVRI